MTDNHSNSQTLDLISIFHYVLAALIYLKGAAAFIFMGIGSIAVTALLADQPDDMLPGLIVMGIIFFLAPMFFLTISWTIATLVLFAGRRIGKRTNLAYCQIIAGLECICIPFGTILGIITLINLTKPNVKEEFQV